MKLTIILLSVFLLLFAGPLYVFYTKQVDLSLDWRNANRSSAKLAPNPQLFPEAVIQAYAARAYNWRGLVAVHTWLAVKPKNAKHYIVLQIVGWNLFYGKTALMVQEDIPDRYWFGSKPETILDIRGDHAEKLIPKILDTAKNYPHHGKYVLFPGPNSNTFIAHIGRKVPELGLVLPSTAIGKDYISSGQIFDRAISGSGYQFSLLGLLSLTLAAKEGLEVNLLGLSLGINPIKGVINWPGIGAIELNSFR